MMIKPQLDQVADAAYLSLSTAQVARTVSVNDAIAVDMDVTGTPVGIEVIGLSMGPQASSGDLEQLESLGVPVAGRDALLTLLSGGAA